jgi:hypothetical protein
MASDSLIKKIDMYRRSQVLDLSDIELGEMRSIYQNHYRDTFDAQCSICIGNAIRKIIKDNVI